MLGKIRKKLSEKRLRIAIIGLGKMGLLHASILNTLPEVQLVALCDKSYVIRKFYKKIFNKIPVVDDVERLSGLALDAVYVTTPISSHYSVTRTVYLKGIARNVFVEKSLASSYSEAKELYELAERFKGVNIVGYQKRLNVCFKKAKDLLSQGNIGDVISFRAYAYSSDMLGVKKASKPSKEGVLRDLGAHIIDLALWFFGDLTVDPISVNIRSMIKGYSEDYVYFKVIGLNGLEGEFSISWCKEGYRLPEFGMLIKGSKGIIKVNDDKVKLKQDNKEPITWYRHDLNDNVGFLLGAPEYFREDKYFITSVLENRNAEPSFRTASKVEYLIDHVKHEAKRNQ